MKGGERRCRLLRVQRHPSCVKAALTHRMSTAPSGMPAIAIGETVILLTRSLRSILKHLLKGAGGCQQKGRTLAEQHACEVANHSGVQRLLQRDIVPLHA